MEMNDGEDAARLRTAVAEYRKKLLQQKELESKVRSGLSKLHPLKFCLVARFDACQWLDLFIWVAYDFGFLLFSFVVVGASLDLGFFFCCFWWFLGCKWIWVFVIMICCWLVVLGFGTLWCLCPSIYWLHMDLGFIYFSPCCFCNSISGFWVVFGFWFCCRCLGSLKTWLGFVVVCLGVKVRAQLAYFSFFYPFYLELSNC